MKMKMKKSRVSNAVIRRLPRYYRHLSELQVAGVSRVSSNMLGKAMGFTASQIRQDLCCFGCFGQQGSGYSVAELRENLQRIMGLTEQLPAIVIGAGSLGKVVSENVRFEQRGFRLIGIFDIKPELIGRQLAGLHIQSMDELDAFCAANQPAAAVLCLPKESAQAVAERLVSLGVRGLWNFSHCDLAVEQAQVVTMHLDDSLMTLSYKLHNL